jgi:hypothetical protein
MIDTTKLLNRAVTPPKKRKARRAVAASKSKETVPAVKEKEAGETHNQNGRL